MRARRHLCERDRKRKKNRFPRSRARRGAAPRGGQHAGDFIAEEDPSSSARVVAAILIRNALFVNHPARYEYFA